jgi:hypothetical protein
VRAIIRAQLATSIDPLLVDELLEAHEEAKRSFYLGGDRLSAVEGGRFCEAAFRILEQITTGRFTPLRAKVDTQRLIQRLEQLPSASHVDSVRVHIPRALRVVYDIRNNRDAAHLADGIDPNVQDSTLVVGVIDWVLAEFVRLYHNVSPNEARRIVEDIVSRKAPVVQEFGDFLKVLRTDLGASDHCIVLLYHRGANGATAVELSAWAKPAMRLNLRRTLRGLEVDKSFIHFDGSRYFITRTGEQYVETNRMLEHP